MNPLSWLKTYWEYPLGVLFGIGFFIWMIGHHNSAKPIPIPEDPRIEKLRERISYDSAARALHEATISDLNRRLDSLTQAESVARALPLPRLETITHIKTVFKDTLACLDTASYRRLALSSLGASKYTLCLGEVAEKDSILKLETGARLQAVDFAESCHVEKARLTYRFETERPRRLPWLLSGLAAGVVTSMALYIAIHR